MTQSSFAIALLNPDAAMPDGLQDPQGRAAPKRFSVYRNNVTSSLISVMEAAFPVIRKLVGAEFYSALAAEFIRTRPPKSRIMMLYGSEFAEFLRDFPPVAHLGYLGDVAALEQALRESYHAADAAPTPPQDFAALDEAELMVSTFAFAPSARVIASPWPIHGIWFANTSGGAPPLARAETVLVLRPDFDPVPHLITPAEALCVNALLAGKSLATACANAGQDLDLVKLLALLIQNNAITRRQP